jgi:hypothetical protein
VVSAAGRREDRIAARGSCARQKSAHYPARRSLGDDEQESVGNAGMVVPKLGV